ncbi:MAG: hypothetical protein Q8L05_00940 [Actinomycetota bacterium]|nr:hypothetical protein [Actinomycetota bacterium]MDP2287279.1 hypothetical protein [Actinomycetota bacterium]
MNPESLAQMSNVAIYSWMLTLAMAMVAFAASFESGKRRQVVVTATETTMRAGGTAVLTKPVQKPGDFAQDAMNFIKSLSLIVQISSQVRDP